SGGILCEAIRASKKSSHRCAKIVACDHCDDRQRFSAQTFCARKFLLADAIHYPTAARLRLRDCISNRGPTISTAGRPKWSDPGGRFSLSHSFAAWFADGRNVALAHAVLVWSERPRAVELPLDGLPHHGRRRIDQTAGRPVLARPDLHVLSLRNSADPESDQPLSALCAALVS